MSMVIPKRSERKYEPYPEYKDSGIEWLGEIPAYWDVKKLKYLCTRSAIYGANETTESYTDEGMRFLRTSDINDKGELLDDSPVYIDPVSVQDYRLINGDLLVSRSGTLGRSFLYDNKLHGECAYAGYLVRFVPNKKLVPKFAFYFTKSATFIDWLQVSAIQSTIGNVNGQKYANMPMSTPDVTEQQAIADFLDQETTRIDELIAKKQRLIDLLQEQRTALITRTVTKGLNPGTPMKDSGIEWLGQIPAYWDIKRLKWTITSCSNGIWGDEETGESDVVCVRVADFDRVRLTVVDDKLTWRSIPSNMLSRRKLQEGDLLLEKSGGGEQQPVGAVVLYELDYEAVCSNFVACMKIADGHNSRFLNYFHYALYSSGVNIRSIKQTTGIQNLDSYYYLNELTPVPDINEQQAIADYLDQETSRIDTLVGRINQAIEKLQEYRSTLITAAVTGKIDVREQVS